MNAYLARTHPAFLRQYLILASPILVVVIGHFAARLFLHLFGAWAWVGSSLVYWGTMLAVIWLLKDQCL